MTVAHILWPVMPCPLLLHTTLFSFSERDILQSLPMFLLLCEMLFFLKCLVNYTFSKTQHKYYLFYEDFSSTPLFFYALYKNMTYILYFVFISIPLQQKVFSDRKKNRNYFFLYSLYVICLFQSRHHLNMNWMIMFYHCLKLSVSWSGLQCLSYYWFPVLNCPIII